MFGTQYVAGFVQFGMRQIRPVQFHFKLAAVLPTSGSFGMKYTVLYKNWSQITQDKLKRKDLCPAMGHYDLIL